MASMDILPFGLGKALGPLVAVPAALNAVHIVKPGEGGVRTRWKQPRKNRDGSYKIVGPGKYFTLPGLGSVEKISLQNRTIDLGPQEITRQKNYLLRSGVVWGVAEEGEHRIKAMYKFQSEQEMSQTVGDICLESILETALVIDEDKILNDPESLRQGVRILCSDFLLGMYGVDLRRVIIKGTSIPEGQIIGDKIGSIGSALSRLTLGQVPGGQRPADGAFPGANEEILGAWRAAASASGPANNGHQATSNGDHATVVQ